MTTTLPRLTICPAPATTRLGTLASGAPLELDLDKLIATRLLIQASSGGGKSYLIRKLLEETHGRVTQIVFDPEGEFSTLTERFKFTFVAPNCAEHVDDAGPLALATIGAGSSLLVDLYELEADDRVQYVANFITTLMAAPKGDWRPCLVVIDEAHLFIPDKVLKLASARPLIDLASRGRKRGFACVLATQRLSKLHKDVAAECLNKLIGRTSLERDLRRAGDELGLRGPAANALRGLRPGQFFAYGPALTMTPELATIDPVKTEHGAPATATEEPAMAEPAATGGDGMTDLGTEDPLMLLTRRARAGWIKMRAYLAENPKASTKEACAAAEISASMYYAAKRTLEQAGHDPDTVGVAADSEAEGGSDQPADDGPFTVDEVLANVLAWLRRVSPEDARRVMDACDCMIVTPPPATLLTSAPTTAAPN